MHGTGTELCAGCGRERERERQRERVHWGQSLPTCRWFLFFMTFFSPLFIFSRCSNSWKSSSPRQGRKEERVSRIPVETKVWSVVFLERRLRCDNPRNVTPCMLFNSFKREVLGAQSWQPQALADDGKANPEDFIVALRLSWFVHGCLK